jgi:CO dehydrogenase maturation factor
MSKSITIAMCGKGGVGKTTISALLVKSMADRTKKKILAIDADPAIGLSYALGVEIIKTVDDIRSDLIKTIEREGIRDKSDTIHMLDYEVFDALVQHKNFALLAIGRPEGEGCYCQVNNLLKEIIEDLSEKFDVIFIDGEAGIEQIDRRVMKTVDCLVLVSDTSAKGINVAKAIKKVARENQAVNYKKVGLLLNRIKIEQEVDEIMESTDLDLLGWIPEDPTIREYDFYGKSYFDFPESSPASIVIHNLLDKIGI